MEQREKLKSRLGFILISAGCAIGLGNVWTFPWRTSISGGGAFVLIYLLCCIVIGLPVMVAEFSIGRKAQVSPIKMWKKLEKPGQKWGAFGVLGLIGNVALMAFYTTISGFIWYYFIKFLTGKSADLSFSGTYGNIPVAVGFMILVVVLGFFILSFDLQKGLESVTKNLMVGLFFLMIVLAIYVCTLPGAKAGLSFYLKPDFSVVTPMTFIKALNQSFFSLSLGMGSMAIFGSYIGKERSLLGESVNVVALDTLAALLAGFIIFPVVYTYSDGIQIPGPELLFTTMANLFNNMGTAGRVLGSLFFLFMVFASMSTVFAVLENILAMVREMTGWSRKKGCLILGIGITALSIPMALGGSVFRNIFYFAEDGPGFGFLDFWSMIVEKICQPLGAIAMLLFVSWGKIGMGWTEFLAEANAGKGLKVAKWMRVIFGIIAPAVILFVFIYGLATYGWAFCPEG